ncbi:nudix hydrolase 20, chloroplastic isoform X2 [Arabidopsis lyrata subsp. lyrata]|nr:nudix hydrolase 20, chloroplastic isoform X2 [Arabidopsis lyrata subsp. lyrata]XP_020879401.1 nudix hydrolase 20, chloroplastic isoform X2 [Arabidopsis lyrata subsp. lyrata]|eukprot:XP_002871886.2 nudix hydrolase 20, chloroplastic isoform X2 [Arabidopsis lyrata subsp. lyrata]
MHTRFRLCSYPYITLAFQTRSPSKMASSGFCSLVPTVTSLFSSHALARWRSSSMSPPPLRISRAFSAATTVPISSSFTWDDVIETGREEYTPHNSSDLTGFLEKVDRCNRGSEKLAEFIPFVIEEQIVGYIHKGFTEYLREFHDIFTFSQNGSYHDRVDGFVTLNLMLEKPEDRTRAVADVIKVLGDKGIIPGIRNELYPVKPSFNAPVIFSLERAAAPYFGIKGYGVHMNGYVERDAQKFLWIGKRSLSKSTYPGMLDHLVAGGLPHGISCGENLVKECEEEAGISKAIADRAIAVGAVSYMDIDQYCFKRDVLFCYDLELPQDFVPKNQDGEVESFKLIPVAQVANVIRKKTSFFKANCSLVIIDFLFRHGFIRPESSGYLHLYGRLRNKDCS